MPFNCKNKEGDCRVITAITIYHFHMSSELPKKQQTHTQSSNLKFPTQPISKELQYIRPQNAETPQPLKITCYYVYVIDIINNTTLFKTMYPGLHTLNGRPMPFLYFLSTRAEQ